MRVKRQQTTYKTMNNNNRTFASLVIKSGLTQTQIGRILGVTQSYVSRMASGERNASPEYISSLRTKLAKKEKEKKAAPAKPKKRSR